MVRRVCFDIRKNQSGPQPHFKPPKLLAKPCKQAYQRAAEHLQPHPHRNFRLTVGEVGHFRRKWDVVERVVLHVLVHVQLGLTGLQERHEPCGEGGHEDGQHPEIQEVPQVQHVLPRPLLPDFLAFGPDHSCGRVRRSGSLFSVLRVCATTEGTREQV